MRKCISSILTLVATLVAVTPTARAQGTFRVRVTPRVVSRSGDSLSLSYTVTVLPGSTDSLASFIVDAPGTTLHVVRPAPRTAWTTMIRWRHRGTAEWALLEGLTRAG